MARFHLRHPDQPWWVRWGIAVYEWAASLQVAVVLIGLGAFVLGWATFVEKWYGTEAVSFGIYRSWWFALLLGLLAWNVLCATLIRLPWKKHQTGFVITHAGILVLLLGCLAQWLWGVQGMMVVYEGEASSQVFLDEKIFRLKISSTENSELGSPFRASAGRSEEQTIEIPFRSGPFHWKDYERLSFFPWRMAPRDQGVIYQREGIRLEVLDYCADSERVAAPRLGLLVALLGAGATEEAPGAVESEGEGSSRLTLKVTPVFGPEGARRPWGIGDWQNTPWGPPVVFWMTGVEAEQRAFLEAVPEGAVGPLGQVVLWHQGKVFRFPVEELQKAPERDLGDKGLKVHFLHQDSRIRAVELEVRQEGGPGERMFLFAQNPSHNRHADGFRVYGSYWVEPPEVPAPLAHIERVQRLRLAATLRLDILQGPDGKLYYRQWQAPHVTARGPWPENPASSSAQGDRDAQGRSVRSTPVQEDRTHGVAESAAAWSRLRVFTGTPLAMEARIVEFRPAERPRILVEPKPLDNPDRAAFRQPRAKIRLTVEGNEGEFWVPLGGPRFADERIEVSGGSRRVEVLFLQRILDLGIKIYLHDFTRKMDPGSPHESHYSSLVDVWETDQAGAGPKLRQENVLITMNQPLSAKDPKTGRWYRFYQAAFEYIGKPGDPRFDEWWENRDRFSESAHSPSATPSSSGGKEGPVPEDLYCSKLSVNYDPGRGLKYAGSALIVAGIAVMYLMRAYIFAPRAGRTTSAEEPPPDKIEIEREA